MSKQPRIVVIGAGSASFGENTLSAILRSKKLRGSSLALVDHNPEILAIVKKLADRLDREWDAGFNITACLHHKEALENADFVISAIEVGARENLWRKDFEIPLKHGIHQPYAENGGPGGFFHAARNIPIILGIAHDMEKFCPDAWLINFTNPMIRICDAVNRHSTIKAVGLCHQIYIAYMMVGIALAEDLGFTIPEGITGMHADVHQAPLHDQVKAQAVPRLDIRAAGLNHFSWILSINDRKTGEDLYPLFRNRWKKMNPDFEPLTRRVFDAFGLFPVPGDTHLCEYLPWVSDPVTKPWGKYNIRLYDWDLFAAVREFSHARLADMANGEASIEGLLDTDSEGALEIIENISTANTHYHLAANLPNEGQIANLPIGSPVETPVIVDGAGVHPVHCGSLPEPISELLRRELMVSQLCVDSVVNGDRNTALQALLLDPIINDFEQAKTILDEYLLEYREFLPGFWK
jgi:alpha-galactosidase